MGFKAWHSHQNEVEQLHVVCQVGGVDGVKARYVTEPVVAHGQCVHGPELDLDLHALAAASKATHHVRELVRACLHISTEMNACTDVIARIFVLAKAAHAQVCGRVACAAAGALVENLIPNLPQPQHAKQGDSENLRLCRGSDSDAGQHANNAGGKGLVDHLQQ